MPQLSRYTYTGPVDHTVVPDRSKMSGKSVIVTGGANGIGEACVRAFAAAGAFVTFGDLSERGKELEKELNAGGDRVAFVRCDICSWDEQKTLFETAVSKSPNHSVDVVLANAGISRSSGDSLWNLDGMTSSLTISKCCLLHLRLLNCYLDPQGEPTKPNLNIVRVNVDGTMYTWKLATHYFRRQPDNEDRDRCFIMTGSMVAWIDSPVSYSLNLELHCSFIQNALQPALNQLRVSLPKHRDADT